MSLAFVIMPFRHADFTTRYKTVIKPSIESVSGWRCKRADEHDDATYVIGKEIVRQIEIADVVIADLTTLNPNVFYELGVAHSFGTNVLMIADALEGIPFDLHDYRVYQYRNSSEGHVGLSTFLISSLQDMRWTRRDNNPVHHHSSRIRQLLDFRSKAQSQTDNSSVAENLYKKALRHTRTAPFPITKHVVQICGGVAVGKTTFAKELARVINAIEGPDSVAILSLDAYQFSRLEREAKPISHGFAADNWRFERAQEDLANYLTRNLPIRIQEYDHYTGLTLAAVTEILPAKYLIVEGLIAFNAALLPYGTFRIFIGGDNPRHEQNLRIKVAYHERDYSLRAAVRHSEGEFRAYLSQLLPLRTHADVTLEVCDEWSYRTQWRLE